MSKELVLSSGPPSPQFPLLEKILRLVPDLTLRFRGPLAHRPFEVSAIVGNDYMKADGVTVDEAVRGFAAQVAARLVAMRGG